MEQHDATLYLKFKTNTVIRSDIEIAITPPRIARFRWNLIHGVSSHRRRYTTNVQG